MKLSLNWLESYFDQKPNWELIWHKLTIAGIEVENIKNIALPFSGIVVAKVTECIKHPNADKLNVCKVDIGSDETLQIICGASNVKAGVKVPCAKVNAILPDGLVITQRDMRGITSFGMLCSGSEIDYPDGVDGLLLLPDDAPIGVDVRDYLKLDDKVIEFKITPNRGDCLSVMGILREIKALTDYTLKTSESKQIEPIAAQISDKLSINMTLGSLCPNYISLVVKNVNNQVKLPDEIIKRLNLSGIKSISPVVDITNYVMLEVGQPLHAFDLNKIGGQLQIRMANNSENLRLIDGKTLNLHDNTLVICGSDNQVIAIGGVVVGSEFGITPNTTDLVLESAYFTPETIAGITKQYGINSDAAYRYERGVDPQLQLEALIKASKLITKYCQGQVGIINQVQSHDFKPKSLDIDYRSFTRLIGTEISSENISFILQKLGFVITKATDNLHVIVPSYRFDIKIKQDIIEEVARVYGYDNIAPVMPLCSANLDKIEDTQTQIQHIKQCMIFQGYTEIINYAFIEDKFEKMFGNNTPVELQNSIAGLNVMRTSLIAGLVKTLINNLNRGHKHMKLFELSRVFHGEEISNQPLKVAALIYGDLIYPNALNPKIEADFYDLKHVVQLLLPSHDFVTFESYSDSAVFHKGRCAKIYVSGHEVGIIGQLHPKLGQELGLALLPYMFELDIATISQPSNQPSHIYEISKFQKVARDLAFTVANDLPVGIIVDAIKKAKINYLLDLTVFDIFLKANINEDKSVALHFIFQANKTLSENEVNDSIDEIINLMQHEFNAVLRK